MMADRLSFSRPLPADFEQMAAKTDEPKIANLANAIARGRRIVRVQDDQGRGPWRPGLSRQWVRDLPDNDLAPIHHDLEGFIGIVDQAHCRGLNIGCAVRMKNFGRWFNASECKRLKRLGFHIADCSDCKVLGETPHQVLVGLPRWLWTLPRLDWSEVSP